jgi:hypothetical protein
MSLEAQRVYLTERLAQVKTGVPMELPNQKFKQPKDGSYGSFHIMGGDPITIGSEGPGKKRVRYVHMLQMTIWIPEDEGMKAATMGGDNFKERFANKQGRDRVGAVYRFGDITPSNPTKTAQGWTACVFRIPYTRDIVEKIEAGFTL